MTKCRDRLLRMLECIADVQISISKNAAEELNAEMKESRGDYEKHENQQKKKNKENITKHQFANEEKK